MDIKLFGLTLDKSGVVRAMKDVTDSGVQMARDGAKNAQLYADAYREKLNVVARQVIPETMRALDSLREREVAVATASRAAAGDITRLGDSFRVQAVDLRNAERGYAAYVQGMKESAAVQEAVTASAGGAVQGFGRIRQGLVSLIAQATGTIPVLDRIVASFGGMAVGSGLMLGALAGLAAVALAYRYLTKDARDAEAAQDASLKKLEEWDKKRHLGPAGEFGEDVAGGQASLQRQIDRRGAVAGIASIPGMGGLAAALGLVITDTPKQAADAAQAVADAGKVLGEQTTRTFLEQRAREVATLTENINSHNATHAERVRAAELLKQDLALMAQYRKADVSGDPRIARTNGELRSALGSQIEGLQSALHPTNHDADRDANKSVTEARALEQIAAAEERRVAASRALDDAAQHGQAAYAREQHSQELQNQLLETENRIRAAHLDITGKVRDGEEEAMNAEIARAREAIQTRDTLDEHAKASLSIEKDDKAIAILKAKIDAYNGVGAAIKDASAEEVYNQAVIAASAVADKDQRQALLDRAAAIRDLTVTLHGAEAAHKASTEAARHAAEDEKKAIGEVNSILKSSFSSFFTGVLSQGKNIFQQLWDSIKQGFIRMLADMLAASATARIAGAIGGTFASMLVPGMAGAQGTGGSGPAIPYGTLGASDTAPGAGAAGYAGIGLAAFTGGYAVGGSMYSTSHGAAGNYARGALGGAAAGAAMGAALGSIVPGIGTAVGAIVGGAVGFIGGVLGMGAAAKEAAKAMAEAQKQVALSMASLRANVTHDTVAAGVADIETDREARRKAIEDAYAGGGADSDQVRKRNAALAEMNALEDQRIAILKKEYAQQQEYDAADLKVRLLRAQGKYDEADALAFQEQQQKEYNDAVNAGKDATYLAMLAETQRAEAIAHTTDALQEAVRNAPSGFKVSGYTYDFSSAAGSTLTPGPAQTSGGTTVLSFPNATFKLEGATGQEMVTNFISALRTKAAETVGSNVPLSTALDRI